MDDFLMANQKPKMSRRPNRDVSPKSDSSYSFDSEDELNNAGKISKEKSSNQPINVENARSMSFGGDSDEGAAF